MDEYNEYKESIVDLKETILNNLKNSKLFIGIAIGIFSSYVASFLFSYSPYFLRFLSQYSLGLLTGFVDAKVKQAATLESINYSFYILVILFVLISFFYIFLLCLQPKIKAEKNKMNSEIAKEKRNNKKEKIFRLLINFVIIIFFIIGFFFIMGESMVLNDISNFKHNLRILTPYMSGTEKDMIISEWSQMDSFDDYRNVYNKLNEIAKNQNIKLQFNRFY